MEYLQLLPIEHGEMDARLPEKPVYLLRTKTLADYLAHDELLTSCETTYQQALWRNLESRQLSQ